MRYRLWSKVSRRLQGPRNSKLKAMMYLCAVSFFLPGFYYAGQHFELSGRDLASDVCKLYQNVKHYPLNIVENIRDPVLPMERVEMAQLSLEKRKVLDTCALRRLERRSNLRYARMRSACRHFYNVSEYDPEVNGEELWKLRGFMTDAYSNDDYNFTVFTVMKVGSWHWNGVIKDLYAHSSPEFRRLNTKPLIPLMQANRSVYLTRFRSHFKVLFVRHPLVRIVSAWRDKFVDHHSAWYRPWAQRMIRMFREKTAVNTADQQQPTPSILEFVRYITESGDDEVHWRPVWKFYRPCRIHFDFIGRLETVGEDSWFVLTTLGVGDKAKYRRREAKRQATNVELTRKTLAVLPQDVFKRLVKKYEEDFRLFGYHVPENASDIQLWAPETANEETV